MFRISHNLTHSSLSPLLGYNVVHINVIIFIAVGKNFAVLTQECSLIKCIFVRHTTSLLDNIDLSIQNKCTLWRATVFLASKYQYFILVYRASSEPVLYFILERLRPDLNEFPLLWWTTSICVKSFDISDCRFVPTKHIDVSFLYCHSSW